MRRKDSKYFQRFMVLMIAFVVAYASMGCYSGASVCSHGAVVGCCGDCTITDRHNGDANGENHAHCQCADHLDSASLDAKDTPTILSSEDLKFQYPLYLVGVPAPRLERPPIFS